MKEELVSIIMPLYNSEKFIDVTLKSVLNQTYKNFEILITDDLSKDDGANKVLEYQKKDSRIKLFKLKVNSGAGIARNNSIAKAKGRYIAFLDSDDLWKPNKLEKQIEFMKKNNCAFSFTEYEQISENGLYLGNVRKVPKLLTYKEAIYYNPIGCLTAIYDTNMLGKVYMPSIRKRQDYALWLKILKKTDGFGINQNLASYRIRENSISSNKISLLKWHWKLYREQEKMNLFKSAFHVLYYSYMKILKMKEER